MSFLTLQIKVNILFNFINLQCLIFIQFLHYIWLLSDKML